MENRERLERAITRYSIVAWRLLGMTYPVRVDPNQSPTMAFSPAEIAVWERLATTKKPIRPAGHPLTLRDAVRAVAKLAGFLGRKSHGEPGVKALWRGYRPLQWLCGWDRVRQNPSEDPPYRNPSRLGTGFSGALNHRTHRRSHRLY